MSILFLVLHSFYFTGSYYDVPIFCILVDLDLLVLMRLIWLVRRWR